MKSSAIRMILPFIVVCALGGLGCGEESTFDEPDVEETEDFRTTQQALRMNLRLQWHSHDRVAVVLDFPERQTGQVPYHICFRTEGSRKWDKNDCYERRPDSTPSLATSICDLAGRCQTAYTFDAVGGCGETIEVRVQEGKGPFFREIRQASLHPCEMPGVGGTLIPAGGGHTAGCLTSPSAPAGTNGFTYMNHFYHTTSSPGHCPLPGSSFDGVNCKVRSIPRSPGFVRWPGDFLYRPYHCP